MVSKYSVKRPFTVLVGVILVIVLGVVSLTRMTTDLLPDMSFPYALIMTTDVGASPEEVESEVTAPVEAAMATTSNIKSISSTSYNSYSMVVLEYEQNTNMDSVLIEIQQSLDQLKSSWDDSIGSPTIMQIDPDMMPIMMTTVDIDGMNASEISDYVESELIPSLESVEGVASVTATGAIEEQLEVTLNQEKIDALNEKIQAAIDAQFADAQKELDDAKAQVESGQSELTNNQDQLTDTVESTLAQRDELYKNETDLRTQLADLQSQEQSLETVQSGLNDFMAQGGQYEQLQALEAQIQAASDMGASKADIAKLQAQLDAANQVIVQQFAGLSALGINVNGYQDIPTASAAISSTLTQVKSGIATINSALEQIAAGKVTLESAIDTLNANAALAAIQIGSGSAQLATTASSLEEAQSALDEAKENAHASADLNGILTVDTISGIMTAQNFDMPAGYVNDGDVQYLVKVGESVNSVEELEQLVLMDMNMDGVEIIRLTDVADVQMVDNSGENYAVVNGNPGLMLSMEKQTGYSTGDVTDRLLERFESLEAANPDLHMAVLMDQGIYIDMIVDNVLQNIVLGALLAIIVLLLFLKDIKATLVIACSIPMSVIFAVVLMYFTDISLNIISMSGLVLGIGMLVDNSIVVIENIYRLRGEGYSIKQAAVQGSNQVAGAIFASTLTTISVYAPIIFTDGITRQLFVDIALTIAFTLAASLIVALTFVPAMSAVLLKKTKEIKHPLFEKFRDVYGKLLEKCLRIKPLVFILAIVLLVASTMASLSQGFIFMDMDMESNQMTVTLSAKEDEKLTFDEMTALADETVSRLMEIEGIDTIGAMAGGGGTMSMMGGGSEDSVSMYLVLEEDTDRTIAEISDEITEKTKDLDCMIGTDSSSMDFTSFFGNGLSVQIKGSELDKLQELAAQVSDILAETEGTTDIEDGLDDATPEFAITVDKEKAAEYGYTVAQVFQLVNAEMASSSAATKITADLNDYEVYVQSEQQSNTTLEDIKTLTFTYTNNEGEKQEIPISDICEFEETTTLSTISRDAQTRYMTVSCGVDEDHNVTLLSNEIKEKLEALELPDGYSVAMTGEDETINESMGQLVLMLLLAVVFIYLIMVAQFQSLLSPFIIMFTIPLAFTGGFFALFITGNEVSIIAMLGFIMLAGLIVNNGIVLIDYINQARREGVSKHDAIIDAGRTRLRPILMTALTTILSMSTMAVGFGSGSEMMQPMAITIIGGLVYGTLLTLFIVPCIYDAFHREKSMVEEEL